MAVAAFIFFEASQFVTFEAMTENTDMSEEMNFDTTIIIVFVVLVLVGSAYTCIQNCFDYAKRNQMNPDFVLPPIARDNPSIMAGLIVGVWGLRIALFVLVFRQNDFWVAAIAVGVSVLAQKILYSFYPDPLNPDKL